MGIVGFVETLGAIGALIFVIVVSIPLIVVFWILFWIMGWLQYIYWAIGIIVILFLISKFRPKKRHRHRRYSRRKRGRHK